MRKKRIAGRIETRARKIVRARLQRGDRDRVAEAAGHLGPWLSGWLAGRQDATIDEIAAILAALKVSTAKVIEAPDADEIDWQVFGAMSRLTTPDKKADALTLVSGLADETTLIVSTRPSATTEPRLNQANKRAR